MLKSLFIFLMCLTLAPHADESCAKALQAYENLVARFDTNIPEGEAWNLRQILRQQLVSCYQHDAVEIRGIIHYRLEEGPIKLRTNPAVVGRLVSAIRGLGRYTQRPAEGITYADRLIEDYAILHAMSNPDNALKAYEEPVSRCNLDLLIQRLVGEIRYNNIFPKYYESIMLPLMSNNTMPCSYIPKPYPETTSELRLLRDMPSLEKARPSIPSFGTQQEPNAEDLEEGLILPTPAKRPRIDS